MKKHYSNIDLMKGICILIVAIEHARWTKDVWLKSLYPFWGRIAIPCFMVISGFLQGRSNENKTLKQAYEPHLLWNKLKRYLQPFLFVFLLEVLFYFIGSSSMFQNFINTVFHYSLETSQDLSLKGILTSLIIGGYGPGNYYTPVIIQLILFYPLIYRFIRKFEYKGLCFSFFFCLCSELWQYNYKIPNSIYRNLLLRHMMTLSFGAYYSLGLYKRNKILNLLSAITGISYIILHSYYGYTPYFFNRGWADVCFMSCMFYIPVIAFFLQKEKMSFPILELIGKASYHIYLTQMFYYNFAKKDLFLSYIDNPYLWCLFSLIIIVAVGLSFYQIETILKKHQTS